MIAPGQLITIARELVAKGNSKQRVRTLWAVAKFAARSATADRLSETLLQLAVDTNLIDGDGQWTGADIAIHRRPFGREDVEHAHCAVIAKACSLPTETAARPGVIHHSDVYRFRRADSGLRQNLPSAH
jgi:hypothetical protein